MERIKAIETIDIRRPPAKTEWTAIIPAAGRGTRLGDTRPKILYPILGKPILEWLTAALDPFVDRFVFVLSPEARPQVEPVLQTRLKGRYDIAIQPTPLGMADAVWQAKEKVHTKDCVVLWGDQVALSRETIAACLSVHASRKNAALTFPTVLKKNPYIHFIRDAQDKLTDVYQAREEAEARTEGENDCGIFFFQTQKLFDIIGAARTAHVPIGKQTGEFNLLPLLPLFDQADGDVMTVRIQRPEESLGVNTPEDARRMEDLLKTRISA